ncbi:hypothetical protein ASG41_19655 [Modestobacter sp. Leaf380]|nr:hypothetical protein ASG41_19655 [Modestobacter sp. Leaf380]
MGVLVTGAPASGRRTLAGALAHALPAVPQAPDAGLRVHLARRLDAAALAATAPVLVLSRADETAGGRAGAMVAAARVAHRWAQHPALAGTPVVVVPVAGLLAAAPATLVPGDLVALRLLAAAGPGEVEELLLRPGALGARLAGQPGTDGRELVGRLGVVGVRLGASLVREGVGDVAGLGAELARRSGLPELCAAVLGRLSAGSAADVQPPPDGPEDDGNQHRDHRRRAGQEADLVQWRSTPDDVGGHDGGGAGDAGEHPEHPPGPGAAAQQQGEAGGAGQERDEHGPHRQQQRGRHARAEHRRGRLRVLLGGDGGQPGP